MHDDYSEIEAALRRLKPRAPSEFCEARIATAMSSVPMWKRRSLLWFSGSAVAACLAMALVVPGLLSPHANDTLDPVVSVAASANDADYTCTDVRRTLSSISPLEVQQTPDGRYFRPYRVEYLNTVKWENTNSNAVLVKSAPSETVQYLPVDLI